MSALHRTLPALGALAALIASGTARAQSSLWDSMIWDQDVWFLPEPDPAWMAAAGVAMLAILHRARMSRRRG